MIPLPAKLPSVCPKCQGRLHFRLWESPIEHMYYLAVYCRNCSYSEQYAADSEIVAEKLFWDATN